MRVCLLVLLILASALAAASSELQQQRMAVAQLFALRSDSPQALQQAYAYADPNITHTVRDVGQFGPGVLLSLEYDSVLFVLGGILGAPPVVLRPSWDPYTTQWIDEDTLRWDYFLNASTEYNATTKTYEINVEGMRYTDFFHFVPNATLIDLDYGIQDPVGSLIFGLNAATFTPAEVCTGLIFPACNVTNASCPGSDCLALTQYANVSECVQALTVIAQTPNPCPFQFISNTLACRTLHAVSSFQLPYVHCAHVPPISPVCFSHCLPACSACDTHASCTASFPTIYEAEYTCRCSEGYFGDGTAGACESVPCKRASDCGFFGMCSAEGQCGCLPSFAWDPLAIGPTSACVCPSDSRPAMNGSIAMCVPIGKCLQRWQCPQAATQYDVIRCARYGSDPYSPWSYCLCDAGYEGGVEYPCVCPPPRVERWDLSAVPPRRSCVGA
jgi:hypothetical protein